MHTIKITPNFISVQAANLSDCRIESNRNFFLPELEFSTKVPFNFLTSVAPRCCAGHMHSSGSVS